MGIRLDRNFTYLCQSLHIIETYFSLFSCVAVQCKSCWVRIHPTLWVYTFRDKCQTLTMFISTYSYIPSSSLIRMSFIMWIHILWCLMQPNVNQRLSERKCYLNVSEVITMWAWNNAHEGPWHEGPWHEGPWHEGPWYNRRTVTWRTVIQQKDRDMKDRDKTEGPWHNRRETRWLASIFEQILTRKDSKKRSRRTSLSDSWRFLEHINVILTWQAKYSSISRLNT